ncbi:MAG: SGNH/GDSL hydrolase family protein [Mesorhizobium sp.]|nr:SGNH/GDSL hydrolase family protein [bacterium M00.F.Ca.ET.205.01.1.1]TGU54473.1 SGNH/GDSL hydrolase family protein [bacterium M00.F.Ca.ET.152.01.1.1]TGV38740.1 SGNH/GDSL hydrolase family protein [Mesorhizobium sp. M00.F.Ca.ET.186.01.1.1]TGZ44046.1 SGNH/GDSL hydrolase family protein [bacterium M00.F.Ca.ET.162.01.1.1]TJW33817.1 MAG: SGNH/GDSL hydrolase family protein [Mesorhizobium sp.]
MDQPEFAQQALQRQIEQDIAKRTQVHQANIQRLAAARDSAATLEAAVVNRPLVMLAQGDSWFDYPLTGNGLPLTDTDVIAQLRRIGGAPPTILNLAHHGDAATDEMSLPKQESMIAALRNKANWLNGKPDAILFSAGGNDIAGEQFCIFLDFNDGHAAGLNKDRFAKALGMIEACYLDLFALRDRVAPDVPIFGHCYDFPIPNGAHPSCAGPWLKPSLDFCNWTVAKGTVIVHDALAAFRDVVKRLADEPRNNFHLVETQGTLKLADWANELHPIPAGFKKIAQKFADALKAELQT